jgi:hypothetical protein
MIDETIAVASTDAATALESLGARPQTATEALRNLVAKIDELTPAINGMTQIAYLHGVPWEAGNWFTELNAAKSALAAAPPPTSQWFSKEELAKIQGLMDHVIPCARRRSLSAKCTCGLLEIDAKIDAILSPPPTEQDKP